MRNFMNLEKSAFGRGRYVGYADGPWRVSRYLDGWRATHMHGRHADFTKRTLADVSAELHRLQISQVA